MARTLHVTGVSTPRGRSVVRVSYSRPPLAANAADPRHALSTEAYALIGPGQVRVAQVATVDGDPRAFDLLLDAALQAGTWTLSVAGVVAHGDVAISGQTSFSFAVAASAARETNPGASSPGTEALMRRVTSPIISGPKANALIAAGAAGAAAVERAAEFTRVQGSLLTAGGKYLEAIGDGVGVERPVGLNLVDDLYRRLIGIVGRGWSGRVQALGAIEIMYGVGSTRSTVDSESGEPFALADGDDLFVVDGPLPPVRVVFREDDFGTIGDASATEVAAVIDRALREAGSGARAVPSRDPIVNLVQVRLLGGALGLSSRVIVRGGRAQRSLRFPSVLPTGSGGSVGIAAGESWSVSAALDSVTFTVSGSVTDLSVVHPGDYACVYGAPVAAENRTTLVVRSVDVRYSGATLVQSFTADFRDASSQVFVAGADDDILFFRPTTSRASAATISQAGGGWTAILPATSSAVQRRPGTAAYLHSAVSMSPTAARRNADGSVDLTFGGSHEFAVGDRVLVDGGVPATEPPSPTAGNGTSTLDASPVSIFASATVASASYPSLARGGVALLPSGDAMVVTGLDGALLPSARAGRVRITGTATLPDGSVQVSYSFVATASMSTARWDCTATLLSGSTNADKLFVAGGTDGVSPITSTELYDYLTNSWSAGPSLPAERYGHAAVQLQTGRVILSGGDLGGSTTASTLVYDPAVGSIAAGPSMLDARRHHACVLLRDGRALAIGGQLNALGLIADPTGSEPISTCEVFDGSSWARTGRMNFARTLHQAVVLSDGRVVAVGGYGHPANLPGSVGYLRECEMWDPTTGRWYPLPPMRLQRAGHVATLMSSQFLVVAGGEQGDEFRTEILDLATMEWSLSPAETGTDRSFGALFACGSAYVWAGGLDTSGGPNPTSEDVYFFIPASPTFAFGQTSGAGAITAVSPSAASVELDEAETGFSAFSSVPSITPSAAVDADGVPGPYSFEPTSGVALAGPSSEVAVEVLSGTRGGILHVAAGGATDFPDEPGYVTISFGSSAQLSLVPYLRRLDSSSLLLDPSYEFTRTVEATERVDLLFGRAPYAPSGVAGSFWLTGSSAGRIAAAAAVDRLGAAGLAREVQIVYPGDRGLGGEGEPTSGAAKLTDAVVVWGRDDVDTELQELREG
jgi:hypothetical protein